MTREPETGESSAAINARADDAAWRTVLPMLQAGRPLVRPVRCRDYYVDGAGGLTAARVKRLEREGVIRRVGGDTYALVSGGDHG